MTIIHTVYDFGSKSFNYIDRFTGPLRPFFVRPGLNLQTNEMLASRLWRSSISGGVDTTTHVAGAFLEIKRKKLLSGSVLEDGTVSSLFKSWARERLHYGVSFLPPEFNKFGLGFIKENPTILNELTEKAISEGAEPAFFAKGLAIRIFLFTAAEFYSHLIINLKVNIPLVVDSTTNMTYNSVPDLITNSEILLPLKECPTALFKSDAQYIGSVPIDIPIKCLKGIEGLAVDDQPDRFLEDAFNNNKYPESSERFFSNSGNLKFYNSDYFFKAVCEGKQIGAFSLEDVLKKK